MIYKQSFTTTDIKKFKSQLHLIIKSFTNGDAELLDRRLKQALAIFPNIIELNYIYGMYLAASNK